MADKRAMMDAILQSARTRREQAELNDPEMNEDQLENDTQAQEDMEYLSGFAPLPKPIQQLKDLGNIFMDSVSRGGFNKALSVGPGSDSPGSDALVKSIMLPGWVSALQAQGIIPTPEHEALKEETEAARMRSGTPGQAASIAGDVAPYLLGPAGRTIKGAMGIGATESIVSDSAEKAFKEGRALDSTEALIDAGFGAGGGLAGKLVGDQVARMFMKKGGPKAPLARGSEKALGALKQSVDKAAKQMDDSQVIVKNSALRDFERSILGSSQFKRWGFGAASSPEAWTAFNVFRAQVGRGKDMGLRELNEMRQTIRKLGKGTHLGYQIDNQLADFISKLDGSKVVSGDVKSGVAGWKEMNKVHFKQKQSELLAKMLTNAEFVTRQGKNGITLDRALQEQFGKLFTTDAGRLKLNSLKYTPEQVELIRDIAEGGMTTQAANRMDKLFGDTLIAPIYRLTLQPILRTAGAEVGGRKAEKLFENVTAMPGVMEPAFASKIGPQVGVGAADALQGNIMAPPPVPGAIQPQQTMPQAPVANAPKVMPRALPEQSRSSIPPDPLKEIGR